MGNLIDRSASEGNSPMGLLVLCCPKRAALLAAILKGIDIKSLWVRRCWETRELLQTRQPLAIVVTDATLQDANWCDVLRAVVDHGAKAPVVVVAPSSADEVLWSEVLWRGAHDMLVEPFTKSQARRILEGALRLKDI